MDWSTPQPNKCHFWEGGTSDLCYRPTKFSVYYGEPRHNLIANVCADHAKRLESEPINVIVRDRWTGKEVYRYATHAD